MEVAFVVAAVAAVVEVAAGVVALRVVAEAKNVGLARQHSWVPRKGDG